MTGVGTLANTAAIVVGGVFGLLLGKRLKPRFQETIVSALPILLYQGAITFAARLAAPVFTPEAMSNLSYVGNLLIFCVGWNLIHGEKKIRVANLLPALPLAVFWSIVL